MATRRRTREQWQELVDKQAESELTVSEFCAQHALTVSNFYLLRISVNPIGRFGFIRSLFFFFFIPASFTLSDRIGLVFSSIRQPVQFDDCCAVNGRVVHLQQWGY